MSMLKRLASKIIAKKDIFEKSIKAVFYGLKFDVKSDLTLDEKLKLYLLSSEKSGVYVEIGSYLGASSCIIGKSAKQNNSVLYCIDTWNNDEMSEGKRETFIQFLENTKNYSNSIFPLRGYSRDKIEFMNANKIRIDFLFIDGDHSYKGVKEDWDLYSALLNDNAIVVLHDSGWSDGVKRVIREEIKSIVLIDDQLPNMYWAWIKK